MSRKSKTSVVIVNYKADAYVAKIQRALKDTSIEVIVIDNSDGKQGYGAGCNRGLEQSHGEYVLFANPDLSLTPRVIQELADFLETHPQVGLLGPQILTEAGDIQITCSTIPTPLEAMIVFSWLGKLPLFSKVVRRYRLGGFDHTTSRPVPAINGSCFMMRREDLQEIGGFDEHLFLYFEEFDLAKRIHDQLEKQTYYLATTSVIHYGQKSTEQAENVSKHFQESRRYWFKKHYGTTGLLANLWISFWESKHV